MSLLESLQMSTAILRDVLVGQSFAFRRRKMPTGLARGALHADLAIVGGGQLIQDGDLNFPVKLSIVWLRSASATMFRSPCLG